MYSMAGRCVHDRLAVIPEYSSIIRQEGEQDGHCAEEGLCQMGKTAPSGSAERVFQPSLKANSYPFPLPSTGYSLD